MVVKRIKWEENEEGRTWTRRQPASRSVLRCTASLLYNCAAHYFSAVQLCRTILPSSHCAARHLSSSFAQWLRACRGAESCWRKTLWSQFCLLGLLGWWLCTSALGGGDGDEKGKGGGRRREEERLAGFGRRKETVVTGGGCSAAVKVEGGGNVKEAAHSEGDEDQHVKSMWRGEP